MKKTWPYLLLLTIVLFVLFRASRKVTPPRIDWRENYTLKARVPLGCYVAADFIDEMMDGNTQQVDRTVYQLLSDSAYHNCNYIIVNDHFQASGQDVDQLCRFVSEGNNVLISATSFGFLADSLKIALTDPLYYAMDNDTANSMNTLMNTGRKSTEANFVNPSLRLPKNAVFEHNHYAPVFFSVDTLHTTLLGTDGNNHPDFIRVKMGKGQFLLHTLPDAFGNYYATDSATAQYLFRVLSYLPKQKTFLDAHYKTGRVEIIDQRRYILSEPALKLAYFVLIIAGLIALLFGGKRRQRPVPVLPAPTNSTLEFVEQVGVLYYRQGNHADIAQKKIAYFLESIRSRFYVQTNVIDDKFVERISNLSSVPNGEVRHLFYKISQLRTATACSEHELKQLEAIIREFNQRSKR